MSITPSEYNFRIAVEATIFETDPVMERVFLGGYKLSAVFVTSSLVFLHNTFFKK